MDVTGADRSLGRVSARAVLASIQGTKPSSPRILPLPPLSPKSPTPPIPEVNTKAGKMDGTGKKEDRLSIEDVNKLVSSLKTFVDSNSTGTTLQSPLIDSTEKDEGDAEKGKKKRSASERLKTKPSREEDVSLQRTQSYVSGSNNVLSPGARLSLTHQLLGVSTSTMSNSLSNPDEAMKMITVNEALMKAGLGVSHIVPFLCMAMIIVLKVFFDLAPTNFTGLFRCYFELSNESVHIFPTLGFLGSIIGSIVIGLIADRYGRRIIAGISLLSLIVILIILTAATNYAMLVVFYTLLSVAIQGVYTVMLVYVAELTPTNKRYLTILFSFIMYSVVSFIIPLVVMPLYGTEAFNEKYWRIPWGLLELPTILALVFLYFSPISPRYASSKGDTRSAHRISMKILGTNHPNKVNFDSVEVVCNEVPLIGFTFPKIFYRPLYGTTILLTAFIFVCNFQYFASHALTEEMMTNRCSCGIDITTKSAPWGEDYFCDSIGQECNPNDKHNRTCCREANNTCILVQNEFECTPYKCTTVQPDSRDLNYSKTDGNTTCKTSTEQRYYIFTALRNLLYLPGFALGIVLAQYKTRKDAFIHFGFYITFINGLLFGICKVANGETFLIFVFTLVFNTVTGAVYSLSWLYALEYYGTNLRCTGVGYLSAIGQFATAIASQLFTTLLDYKISVYQRLTIHLFLSNILTVLSFMLELETKKLPMSDRKRIDCLDHKLTVKTSDDMK